MSKTTSKVHQMVTNLTVDAKYFQFLITCEACRGCERYSHIYSAVLWKMDLSVPNSQRYWERHALTIYTRVGNIRFHTWEDAFLIRCCHGRPDVALCLWQVHSEGEGQSSFNV